MDASHRLLGEVLDSCASTFDDPLSSVQGLLIGCGLGSALWLVILALLTVIPSRAPALALGIGCGFWLVRIGLQARRRRRISKRLRVLPSKAQ